jgi:hypothetical protein
MEKSLALAEQIRNELESAITTSEVENHQQNIKIRQLETEFLIEKNKGENLRTTLDSLQFEMQTLRNLVRIFNENGGGLPNSINDSILDRSLYKAKKTTDPAKNQLDTPIIDNNQWTLIYNKLLLEIERLKETIRDTTVQEYCVIITFNNRKLR